MSRRSFLMDLKAEGALALWHDYRRGDAQDMSGNGNHGTLVGDVVPLGRGLQPLTTTAHILVANSDSIRLTEGTLVGFTTSRFRASSTYQDIMIKRVGATAYEMYITFNGFLGLYDGGLNTSTVSVIDKTYAALNIKNGEAGEVYHDGLFVETLPGGVLTIVPTNDPLSILAGNPTSTQYMCGPLDAAIIVNRKLTATEHAKLYGELANQDWGQRVL